MHKVSLLVSDPAIAAELSKLGAINVSSDQTQKLAELRREAEFRERVRIEQERRAMHRIVAAQESQRRHENRQYAPASKADETRIFDAEAKRLRRMQRNLRNAKA